MEEGVEIRGMTGQGGGGPTVCGYLPGNPIGQTEKGLVRRTMAQEEGTRMEGRGSSLVL